MIKAVIFDLDGVLVSTDELHFQAWKRLANELHISNYTKADNEKQRGVSRMASLELLLAKGERKYNQEEKALLAERKNNFYKELLLTLDESVVLPGVVETLHMLRERNMLIGIGSASKNTHVILQKAKLLSFIDEISCGIDITRSKPQPDVFIVAAHKLKIENDKCLVVEDSQAGIDGAHSAGMKTLGVGPYYKELNAVYMARGLDAPLEWDEILMG